MRDNIEDALILYRGSFDVLFNQYEKVAMWGNSHTSPPPGLTTIS